MYLAHFKIYEQKKSIYLNQSLKCKEVENKLLSAVSNVLMINAGKSHSENEAKFAKLVKNKKKAQEVYFRTAVSKKV